MVVFSSRPLPNIVKLRDGPQMRLSNNLENMIPWCIYCKVQLLYVWKFRLTVLQNHHWKTTRTRHVSQIKVGHDLLNQLRTTGILWSLRILVERKAAKKMSKSSRSEVIEKISANTLGWSDVEENTSELLNRGSVAELPSQ